MKRRYVVFSIRQLKAKLSHLSRTSYRISRKFLKKRLGIDKRDWSRLTKAEIIKVIDFCYKYLVADIITTIESLAKLGFQRIPFLGWSLPDTTGTWKVSSESNSGRLGNTPFNIKLIQYQAIFPNNYQLTIFDKSECKILMVEDFSSLNRFYLFTDHIPSKFASISDFLKSVDMGLHIKFL